MMHVPIEQSSKRIRQFLFSQYFSDGLRITLGVLLPSIVCFQLNQVEAGIAVSLGALCVSIPDNPGPAEHRRNAMLITAGLSALMALVTGLLTPYTWVLAALITVSCFIFSMLNVFGARAASVGISVLVVMVLGIDTQLPWQETLLYAGYILAGGIWYFILSMLSQTLRPYRPAEQTLGECVIEVAKFIRIKADFYAIDIPIDLTYQRILEQQVLVNQEQENVRDILFRTRKLLRDTSPTGRRLLLTFVDLVDLYEQTNAAHHRYHDIREQFGKTALLPYFHQIIIQMAEELEHIGEGFHNHALEKPIHDFMPRLAVLKEKIDAVEATGMNVWVLKRILINLRNIATRIHRMYEYETRSLSVQRSNELSKFVTHQLIDWNLFRANISRSSNHFRHSIRVAIVCLLAFIFTQTVSEGPHSYWILLTILVILKPGFSLTKQRNIERIIGTVAGGIIGLLVLTFFPTDAARFAFLVLFMILTYSFIRLRYVVSVLFMTPYILIVFSFTTTYNDVTVAWERIIDTLIGAGAALTGSYFVFPSWESYQLKTAVVDMLQSNTEYLQTLLERTSKQPMSQSAYRLSRKALYVNTAHLTTAFQRMLSEPKSKQTQADTLYRFGVLNHQLSSYLSTLSVQLEGTEQLSADQLKHLRATWFILKETYEKVSGTLYPGELRFAQEPESHPWLSVDFLSELQQTASDLRKVAFSFQFPEES